MAQSRHHPSSALQPFSLWKPLSPTLLVPLLPQCPLALLHHPQTYCQSVVFLQEKPQLAQRGCCLRKS